MMHHEMPPTWGLDIPILPSTTFHLSDEDTPLQFEEVMAVGSLSATMGGALSPLGLGPLPIYGHAFATMTPGDESALSGGSSSSASSLSLPSLHSFEAPHHLPPFGVPHHRHTTSASSSSSASTHSGDDSDGGSSSHSSPSSPPPPLSPVSAVMKHEPHYAGFASPGGSSISDTESLATSPSSPDHYYEPDPSHLHALPMPIPMPIFALHTSPIPIPPTMTAVLPPLVMPRPPSPDTTASAPSSTKPSTKRRRADPALTAAEAAAGRTTSSRVQWVSASEAKVKKAGDSGDEKEVGPGSSSSSSSSRSTGTATAAAAAPKKSTKGRGTSSKSAAASARAAAAAAAEAAETEAGDSGDEDDGAGGKQSKRERNKISASKYRKRRKQYLDGLEGKCNQLTDQLHAQTKKINALNTENKLLKEQVEFLKNLMCFKNVKVPPMPGKHSPSSSSSSSSSSSPSTSDGEYSPSSDASLSPSSSPASSSPPSPRSPFSAPAHGAAITGGTLMFLFFACFLFFPAPWQPASIGFAPVEPMGRQSRFLYQYSQCPDAADVAACNGGDLLACGRLAEHSAASADVIGPYDDHPLGADYFVSSLVLEQRADALARRAAAVATLVDFNGATPSSASASASAPTVSSPAKFVSAVSPPAASTNDNDTELHVEVDATDDDSLPTLLPAAA